MTKARFEQSENGVWFAYIPGFDGLWATGPTRESARVELFETLDGWIDVHTNSCRATRIEGHQTEETLERRNCCLTQQREVVTALGDLWLSATPALLAKAPSALQSMPLPADNVFDGFRPSPVNV